jgi:(1->4)-alpha-D-glucan 1-alpha-D-glucosylmutase
MGRREHSGWFASGYQPLSASGAAAAHVTAFSRGARAITLATRLPAGLRRLGGWQNTTLTVPAGRWRDVLTERSTLRRRADRMLAGLHSPT